jgi:hypothetical protein
MKSDGVVGGGEEDSRFGVTCRLVDVVKPADVRADHFVERSFDGDAAEMQDRSAAIGELPNAAAVGIGEIG